ncbi:MAG TPA: alkaline phosphatase family protein [Polyangia bacterium]|jgi:phospholipase C
MHTLRLSVLCAAAAAFIGCGGGSGGPADMATLGPDMTPLPLCMGDDCTTSSSIKHVVIVVQENHTFDNYFGTYCTGGMNPTCNTGPGCCEAAPPTEPRGAMPQDLTDDNNSGEFMDRNHFHDCEVEEIDGGKMDNYVTDPATMGTVDGNPCSQADNFAMVLAGNTVVDDYRAMAAGGALADRYFQPYAGQSSANDMYLARAQFVFLDNTVVPDALGHVCGAPAGTMTTVMNYSDPTIANLLVQHGVAWSWYAGGYKTMKDTNPTTAAQCPPAPADCMWGAASFPCDFDPTDVPFEYYPSTQDKDGEMRDFDTEFVADLNAGTLPPVAFVKPIGYKTEHPGEFITISAGDAFVKGVADAIAASPEASSTLLLVTWDEGGGFFDHVSPPATSTVDNQPYGTRVPLIAVGPFTKVNYVSHVQMEHSSIVKFIEWNWLGGTTGQLMGRDATVNNIGDLLDATKTGTAVPAN